jgi:hypothetical protein
MLSLVPSEERSLMPFLLAVGGDNQDGINKEASTRD